MVLHVFKEYKRIFFKVKNKNYDRFLSLFHGLKSSIGGKDPPRNSYIEIKNRKRIKLLYIFLLGELKKFAKKFI